MWQIWLAALSQQSTLSAFTGALHMLRAALIFLLITLLPSPLRAKARLFEDGLARGLLSLLRLR